MKSILMYFGALSLVVVSLLGVGCDNVPTSYNDKEDNKGTIASKMKLSDGFPREALNYTVEDYKGMLQAEIPVLAKRMNAGGSVISMEELSGAIDEIDGKYPAFKDSLPEDVINRIRADFPGVSDEELGANAEEILKLYEAVKTYDVFQELKEQAAVTGRSKSQGGDYPGGLSSEEFWLLFWNMSMKDGTEKASKEALAFAEQEFAGEALWLTRGDGFRHAVWNALIAKHTGDKHKSVSDAIGWAKKFTDAHEKGGATPSDPRDNPMDYHNNAEGREYFKTVGKTKKYKKFWFFGWHYGKKVVAPATATIKSDVKTKTLQGKRFSDNSQLSGLKGKIVWIR